ncbi:MAG: hypothetical protein HN509_06760 [Halobacteriovoraceae bacterium]|jgi:hypothetical protein|nr:hypothetical protein [Halobacteriovoraceae bacterium]MBT5094712.1 hypothetical protein [Halobacteriovoraceae bacterium]
MKKLLSQIFPLSFLVLAVSFIGTANAEQMDQKSATVRLEVAKFARITNLDDFVLSRQSTDGDAASIYDGSEEFRLESNTAVSVSLSGEMLSNGTSRIDTNYALDDDGLSFDTEPGVHNEEHKVSAEATLGQISDQEAGSYSAQITITVAAL